MKSVLTFTEIAIKTIVAIWECFENEKAEFLRQNLMLSLIYQKLQIKLTLIKEIHVISFSKHSSRASVMVIKWQH